MSRIPYIEFDEDEARMKEAEAEGPYPEDHEEPERVIAFYTVALTMVDKAYGGPEEGGWWYTTYTPTEWERPEHVELLPVARRTVEEARESLERMEAAIKRLNLNEGRRELGSVLSTGLYIAHIYEGHPQHEPQQRPHYE